MAKRKCDRGSTLRADNDFNIRTKQNADNSYGFVTPVHDGGSLAGNDSSDAS